MHYITTRDVTADTFFFFCFFFFFFFFSSFFLLLLLLLLLLFCFWCRITTCWIREQIKPTRSQQDTNLGFSLSLSRDTTEILLLSVVGWRVRHCVSAVWLGKTHTHTHTHTHTRGVTDEPRAIYFPVAHGYNMYRGMVGDSVLFEIILIGSDFHINHAHTFKDILTNTPPPCANIVSLSFHWILFF